MRLPLLSCILVATLASPYPAAAQDSTAQDSAAQNGAARDGAPQKNGAPDPDYLPNTGRDLAALIANCETDECMSYVSGAIGGISIYAMLARKPSPFCVGGSVKTDRIRSAIIDTISTTPALQDKHPAIGILAAFGRTWPCMTQEEISDIKEKARGVLAPETVEKLLDSERKILALGPDSAPPSRTVALFHDPASATAPDTRDTVTKLAENSWRVLVFPVSSENKGSAGYGAVSMALRKIDETAAGALFRADPEVINFESALDTARTSGADINKILTAIATSGLYDAVQANNRVMREIGADTAPAWIIGNTVYSGHLGAAAIRSIISNPDTVTNTVTDTVTNASSPESGAPTTEMER